MALKLLAEETNVPLTAAKANIGLATCMRLFNSNGTTVILTTHYLEEAQKMCDRVAILSMGQQI